MHRKVFISYDICYTGGRSLYGRNPKNILEKKEKKVSETIKNKRKQEKTDWKFVIRRNLKSRCLRRAEWNVI